MDVLEKLADLRKQATTENSHFYTASVILEAIHEIGNLRLRLQDTPQPEKMESEKSCSTCSRLGDEMYCTRHCVNQSAWEKKPLK